MNAPTADNLALDQVIEPVSETVTPVSETITDGSALTEAAISQGAGGDNTPSSDKVKSPTV